MEEDAAVTSAIANVFAPSPFPPPRQTREGDGDNSDDDDGEKKAAEANGNGAAAAAAKKLESEESGAPFVDARSAGNGDNCKSGGISDVTGFETDGDALHLRYSSILRGAMSPSPSKEEELEGAG